MDWLEQELKRALERKDPDSTFAARVSAAARRKPLPIAARRWIAIAASVLILTGGGVTFRWYQGMRAKEQVMLAMRLAARKLNRVQARVMETNQ